MVFATYSVHFNGQKWPKQPQKALKIARCVISVEGSCQKVKKIIPRLKRKKRFFCKTNVEAIVVIDVHNISSHFEA